MLSKIIMQHQYVISYFTGTSGRFVSQLIWNSLPTDQKLQIITNFNSVHKNSFQHSYKVESISRFDDTIYKNFSFLNDIGLFNAHKLPNFDDFKFMCERYPNAKFIIISFTSSDFAEIVGNNIYKNGFAFMFDPHAYNYKIINQKIREAYYTVYNKNYPYGDELPPINVMEQIYNLFSKNLIGMFGRPYDPFINPKIPEFVKEKTLVLPYKQLFDVDMLLDTLRDFLQNDEILKQKTFADEYVKGQKELVQQLMPWVK